MFHNVKFKFIENTFNYKASPENTAITFMMFYK